MLDVSIIIYLLGLATLGILLHRSLAKYPEKNIPRKTFEGSIEKSSVLADDLDKLPPPTNRSAMREATFKKVYGFDDEELIRALVEKLEQTKTPSSENERVVDLKRWRTNTFGEEKNGTK